MQPGETLIGVIVMGMGVLLAYSAYRNVPVLGPGGLLTEAIQKGKLPSVPAPTTGTSPPGSPPPGGSPPPTVPPGPKGR